MTSTSRSLPNDLLDLVASRFRLLADPTRLKLIEALRDNERTVGDIAEAAGTSQANASKHLSALLEAALVARRRDGGSVYYRASGRVVYLLIDAVCSGLGAQASGIRSLLAAARADAPRGKAP
jgi:ArsR family transcriptional regulator